MGLMCLLMCDDGAFNYIGMHVVHNKNAQIQTMHSPQSHTMPCNVMQVQYFHAPQHSQSSLLMLFQVEAITFWVVVQAVSIRKVWHSQLHCLFQSIPKDYKLNPRGCCFEKIK